MSEKIYANRVHLSPGVEISYVHEQENGLWVAQPVEMKRIKRGDFSNPMMKLKNGTAQQLMDELWKCGLRPSEGIGSAGSLAATEKHLNDMRQIAFKKLNIKT